MYTIRLILFLVDMKWNFIQKIIIICGRWRMTATAGSYVILKNAANFVLQVAVRFVPSVNQFSHELCNVLHRRLETIDPVYHGF